MAYGPFVRLQIEQHKVFKSPPDSSSPASIYKGHCGLFQGKVSCNVKALFLVEGNVFTGAEGEEVDITHVIVSYELTIEIEREDLLI